MQDAGCMQAAQAGGGCACWHAIPKGRYAPAAAAARAAWCRCRSHADRLGDRRNAQRRRLEHRARSLRSAGCDMIRDGRGSCKGAGQRSRATGTLQVKTASGRETEQQQQRQINMTARPTCTSRRVRRIGALCQRGTARDGAWDGTSLLTRPHMAWLSRGSCTYCWMKSILEIPRAAAGTSR